jgi:MFS family permease
MSKREPLPPLVRQLGWVSFFTDAASELLYPLIPIFLTVTLGAPVVALGLVEGLADGVATGLKALTGYIADRVGEHRRMVRFGYTLSALSKPIMGLAPVWGWVVALRVADRTGKAIRGVPRDLMLAEAVPAEDRGRAFGFHRAMDSAGAVVGPLLALAGVLILGENHLRPVFLIAIVPGIATLLLLRHLPHTTKRAGKKWEPTPLPWRGPYGAFMVVTAVFSLVNSSDAFLLLRAKNLGLSIVQVILAYAVYNVLYTLLSYPAGTRSDRVGRVQLYGAGLVAFAIVYGGFALAGTSAPVWPLLALYGAYMAFTDGISRALVVDLVPDNVRGKALGIHQALTGGCVLIAGITAGILWDTVSPAAPFVVGAVGAVLAAVLLVTTVRVPGVGVGERAGA